MPWSNSDTIKAESFIIEKIFFWFTYILYKYWVYCTFADRYSMEFIFDFFSMIQIPWNSCTRTTSFMYYHFCFRLLELAKWMRHHRSMSYYSLRVNIILKEKGQAFDTRLKEYFLVWNASPMISIIFKSVY